jgi:DNA-binding protein YbaB
MSEQIFHLDEQRKGYLTGVNEKILHLRSDMDSRINYVADENNFITLSINDKQVVLSLDISDILLNSSDKREVSDQLLRVINQAIQKTNKNIMTELREVISLSEINEIISHEQERVVNTIEIFRNNIIKTIQELGSINRSVDSRSGNIHLVMSGVKILQSLEISNEYLSSNSKKILEEELIDILNRGLQEIQDEIAKRLKECENEFYRLVQQEPSFPISSPPSSRYTSA